MLEALDGCHGLSPGLPKVTGICQEMDQKVQAFLNCVARPLAQSLRSAVTGLSGYNYYPYS